MENYTRFYGLKYWVAYFLVLLFTISFIQSESVKYTILCSFSTNIVHASIIFALILLSGIFYCAQTLPYLVLAKEIKLRVKRAYPFLICKVMIQAFTFAITSSSILLLCMNQGVSYLIFNLMLQLLHVLLFLLSLCISRAFSYSYLLMSYFILNVLARIFISLWFFS